MVVMQELADHGMANRSAVAERLIGILCDDVIILLTDEAHFHLSGSVKEQNFHYLAEGKSTTAPSNGLFNVALVIVRWGVANLGVTVQDEDGRAVTCARCIEMLRKFLTPELSRLGTELSAIWFQQDGGTAHRARASIEVVWEIFPELVTSLRGEFSWPARSPDLSVIISFAVASKRKCNPLDHGPQDRSSEENFSGTRKHGEASTGKHASKVGRIVYAVMGNISVMCCTKRNKQRRNEKYVGIKWHSMFIHFVKIN
jgi:hypothetical protein